MNNYDKIEWVHSQLQELINHNEVDLNTLIRFVEDIREDYIKNNPCLNAF